LTDRPSVRHRRLLDRLHVRRAQASCDFAGKPVLASKPASENACHMVSAGIDSAIFAAPTFDDS
jgi:hypothetical protein